MVKIEYEGVKYRQITKSQAELAYKQGKKIFLLPCNVPMGTPRYGRGLGVEKLTQLSFDYIHKEYIKYYCFSKELGLKPAYYIEIQKEEK